MASRLLWASRAASYLRISVSHRGFASACKYAGDDEDGKSHGGLRSKIDLKYAESHEWVKVDGNTATVGITDHAQDHLGDVVFVELPEVGATVSQGSGFGAVESVKATSDVYSPVSGNVVEVNEELNNSPGFAPHLPLPVNSSPYEKGWIMKVEVKDASELDTLKNSDDYAKFCDEEDAKH
ncbi:GLYCINE CLEAVAGE SYSTEM H PROTEIN [Salix purpurea]|uniref:Glycine cleavage system H protein n=1 Tax=Salix purpurea TaxID=77065 RepID=A0A9Q0W5P1_SALPP|nr:GLYCINE CLEAVAGE SYSTEM H PROTEIN [Salix purpurea]